MMAGATTEMATMAETAERKQTRSRGIRKSERLLQAERSVWMALASLLPIDRLAVLQAVTEQAERDELARRRVRGH
jgi:hypothetical protein